MVYAANGGFLIGDTAVVARFAYPQRAGEADAYAEWMAAAGYRPARTDHVNEGQGDLLLVGRTCWPDTVFAPTGAPTTRSRPSPVWT